MRTAKEVYYEVSGYKSNISLYGLLDETASTQCMKIYAKELLEDYVKSVVENNQQNVENYIKNNLK